MGLGGSDRKQKREKNKPQPQPTPPRRSDDVVVGEYDEVEDWRWQLTPGGSVNGEEQVVFLWIVGDLFREQLGG